jgi:DNA-binding CsgD family transcriptional regulator
MARTREQMHTELRATLTSSLKQREVLGRFYEGLSQELLVADYAAFCVSKPGPIPGYDWEVEKLPKQFFARYAAVANQDFVLQTVTKHPNIVLSDEAMVPSHQALRNTRLYRYCKDIVGEPLEHVMAVLLEVGADWHGGFTLYRAGLQPFSDQERRYLQSLTPALASTVRNCRLMAPVAESRDFVEALSRQREFECVVMGPSMTEVMRTAGLASLLERWFLRLECDRSGLPIALMGQFEPLLGLGGVVAFGQDSLIRQLKGQRLVMTCVPLPKQEDRQLWALVFQEKSIVPVEWCALLSPREIDVMEGLLLGLDNKDITAYKEPVTVNTLKTHLKSIFLKLGVKTRTELLAKAAALNARRIWGRSI